MVFLVVGYGTQTPSSITGKAIGGFCAIVGVFILTLPVPIVVNSFASYYKNRLWRNEVSIVCICSKLRNQMQFEWQNILWFFSLPLNIRCLKYNLTMIIMIIASSKLFEIYFFELECKWEFQECFRRNGIMALEVYPLMVLWENIWKNIFIFILAMLSLLDECNCILLPSQKQ